jgi:aminopeptidase N
VTFCTCFGLIKFVIVINIDSEHKSITSDELLQAFENNVNVNFNFTEAFRSWELQKGYPVIHVTHDNFRKQFNITQKRYLSENEEVEANEKWHIPLSFTTSAQPDTNNGYFSDHFLLDEDFKIIPTSTSSEKFEIAF